MTIGQWWLAGRGLCQWMTSRLPGMLLACGVVLFVSPPGLAQATENLRIVGGLGQLNQFTRHERPFWETTLPGLTQGRVMATIVPFDEAGLRGLIVNADRCDPWGGRPELQIRGQPPPAHTGSWYARAR